MQENYFGRNEHIKILIKALWTSTTVCFISSKREKSIPLSGKQMAIPHRNSELTHNSIGIWNYQGNFPFSDQKTTELVIVKCAAMAEFWGEKRYNWTYVSKLSFGLMYGNKIWDKEWSRETNEKIIIE